MNTKVIILLLIVSIAFIVYTNYKRIEIESKVDELEIEQDKNIEKRINEHFSNLPKISFTTNTSFYQKTNYLTSMNQINKKSRNFESHQHSLEMCTQAFQSITNIEKSNTRKLVFSLLEKTSIKSPKYNKYLQYWIPKIKIAKQQPWLEGGMPHTHQNIIILNPSWFQNPRKSTFIHELTHVDQRLNPKLYPQMYQKWGFIHYPKGIHTIKGLENKVVLSRHNPDGLDLNWIWQTPNNTYYWITAEFIRGDQVTLTDVNYLAYQLERDVSNNFYYLNKLPIPLKQWKVFKDYFQISNNHYHPNEIAAQYSEFYLEEKLGDTNIINNSSKDCQGYKIYKEFMSKILTNYD